MFLLIWALNRAFESRQEKEVSYKFRKFQARWTKLYICIIMMKKPIFMICEEAISVLKEFNATTLNIRLYLTDLTASFVKTSCQKWQSVSARMFIVREELRQINTKKVIFGHTEFHSFKKGICLCNCKGVHKYYSRKRKIVVHTVIQMLRNDILCSLLSSYEVFVYNLTKDLWNLWSLWS
jgi:hypothetical protein